MIIKVTCLDLHLHRMIPTNYLRNKEIEFVINNPSVVNCDAWFIFDSYGLSVDNYAICPSNKVFFVMGECEPIKVYNKKFVRQFSNLVTTQTIDYKTLNVYKDYFACWFVGLKFASQGLLENYSYSYEDFFSMQPIKKTKELSVITSNKAFCSGHRERLRFVEKLQNHFGDRIDIFGRGIRNFDDKWDVLAPYKYHIAIENHQQDYYITEKFHDPYLAFCYPIYYGAKNTGKIFKDARFESIDIKDVSKSIDLIEHILEEDPYYSLLPSIMRTRNSLLNEHNMFSKMVKLVVKSQGTPPIEHRFKEEMDFCIKSKIKKIFCLR